MLEKLSLQQRMIIATVLAFAFFIGYDFFYQSKIRAQIDQNQTIASEQKAAPIENQAIKEPTIGKKEVTKQNQSLQSEPLVKIKSPHFHATIDSLGRINSFILDDAVYNNDEGAPIDLVDESYSPLPLEVRFTNSDLNKRAFDAPYRANVSSLDTSSGSQELVLTQDLGEVIVTKRVKFKADGSYEITLNLNKDVPYFITPGFRPNIAVDGFTVHGVLIKKSDDKLEVIKDKKGKASESFLASKIVASSDRYYTALMYDINGKGLDAVIALDSEKNTQVFIKGRQDFKAGGFIGPKNQKLLKSIDSILVDVIEYGWFTFIAKPMFALLSFFYGFVGNWGWSIVVLTIFIRVLLFYPTYKGMISMNKMKDLAPKLKEIQEKYKGDPQKMQANVMELYKKHGANPMGGCLPILIQIPIFFAIYRVLLNAIELKGAEWILWITDLASKDPWYVLPIFMGLMMFLQQRLTPTTFTDPTQEKIMKFLPFIFVFFFMGFPAGLTLYWCVNNTFSVIQQVFVNKIFAKQKEEKELEKAQQKEQKEIEKAQQRAKK